MFLGDKVKELREAKGLSRTRLGEEIGSSDSHIRQIETRQRIRIELRSACRLAKYFGMTLDELIKDTEFEKDWESE